MGGNAPSISKNVVGNETHKSARNVFENIAEIINNEVKKDAEKHGYSLKGKLSQAKFYHPFSKERPYYKSACDLDYAFHSNTPGNRREFRHPCAGRNKTRFSNESEAECGSDKIRVIGNNRNDGACAPYRRRHMCDLNLEHIDVHNTKNSDDLLGNILVTAKYEGESIVKNHPNRGSSEVCIALARSFADIGDVIRGRDMFLGNNETDKEQKVKLEKNLKNIFKKIYEELSRTNGKKLALQARYGKDPNFFQLREDWWALNREDVWKALTCSADDSEDYFIQSESNKKLFSNSKCGHNKDGDPLTNLDYVPQFLRWFNEWSEDFCRVREHKLKKIKEDCRGKNDEKYCSREGYDCRKTNIKRNEIFVDLDCPRCEEECMKYKKWMEKRQEEFNKQKRQYENEIKKFGSKNYDKYYEKFSKKYTPFDSFVETLKEGAYCTNGIIEGKIDFNKQYDTFSHSQYCKSCPILGVNCENGQCNSFNDIPCPKIQTATNIRNYQNESPIDIRILVNDNKKKGVSTDLKVDFNQCDLFKRIRRQHWKCKYKCKLDVCELQNFPNGIDDERLISIEVLIKRWLQYFLKDYNKIKEKLNECINNGTNTLCIEGCYKKCDCVEKWIKEKRGEWEKIKERYVKRYKVENDDISNDLKVFLKESLFTKYIENALKKGENLDNMKESAECIEPNKSKGKPCKKKDVITILLNRLEDKMKSCKTQHEESNNQNCLKTLPPPPRPRGRRRGPLLRRGVRSVRVPRARQVVKNDRGLLVGEEEEEEADNGGDQEVKKEEKEEEETPKDNQEETTKDTTVENPEGAVAPKEVEPPKVDGVKPPCDIVEEHFKLKDNNTGAIDHCNPKKDYPPWKNDKSLVDEDGVYMPPRRQKLCIIKLQHLKPKTSVELRKAFIKCAAAETFLLWHKYKDDKQNKEPTPSELDNNLKEGKIPDDFKRQMFYTFGDYRDICLDKDISKKQGPVEAATNNIRDIFSVKNGKSPSGKTDYEERETWCKTIEKEVWDGMLCALSYDTNEIKFKDEVHTNLIDETNKNTYPNVKFSGDKTTTLEKFAQTPQFLRWFTEWGDEFCREHKTQLESLKKKCPAETCTNGDERKKQECTAACVKYKQWLQKWKTQYKTQSKKYDEDKGKELYKNISDVTSSTKAYQYLHTQLKQFTCVSGDCNCMENASTQPTENKSPVGNTDSMPASLDDEPEEVQGKCSCKPPPKKPEVPPAKVPSACEILDKILKGKDGKSKIDGCNPKNYNGWNCTSSQFEEGHAGACMPPRRISLCIHNLTKVSGKEKLKEAFIECAAIETFWLWHKYKKDKEEEEKTIGKSLDPDNELKRGEIPEEFKRQMFYTFGDYRDLCLDKDIGKDVSEVKKNIKGVLTDSTKNGGTTITAESWWNSIDGEVWDGMLCGLSHASGNISNVETIKNNSKYEYNNVKFSDKSTTLEEFAKRPQFLRWFTEWGEHFCRERKEKVKDLVTKCNNCIVSDSIGSGRICDKDSEGCIQCKKECEAYKNWLRNWRDQYNQQSMKYFEDKKNNKFKSTSAKDEVDSSTHAYHYLKKVLPKDCTAGTFFSCMEAESIETKSKTDNKSHNSRMPASLDDEPQEVEGKCNCKVTHRPQTPLALPPPPPQQARPPSGPQGESGNDHRARSERGEGQRPLPGPRSPQPGGGGRAGGFRERPAPAGVKERPAPRPPVLVPKSKPTGDGGLGRILGPRGPKEPEEEESEEDEEDGDDSHQQEDEPQEGPTTTKVEVETATDPSVNVCETVKKALEEDNLKEACQQKYQYGKEKFPNWKCISDSGVTATSEGSGEIANRSKRHTDSTVTTTKSGEPTGSGSVCVPPRRRKLYLHKVDDNVKDDASLRDWFVKSAAVETFFLWHKYKVDKKKEEKEKNRADGKLVAVTLSEPDELDKKLKEGKIDDEFKRQMFYTLGDYRDICVGKTPDGIDKVSASDKTKDEGSDKVTMDEIQKKIKEHINSVSKAAGGPPGPQNSDEKRKTWWEKNAEDIWNGMVCALTYKDPDTEAKDQPPQQDQSLKRALLDENNKPKKTDNGSDYTYEGVKLEDTSGTGPKGNDDTKLKNFVKRPTYFRWLEEWGEEFCRKQKHKLYIIKKDCKVGENGDRRGGGITKQYSGDGEECSNIDVNKDKIFADLEGQSCATSCSSYRKWIKKKRTEYEKQNKIYDEQKKYVTKRNAAEGNDHDNGFCKTLESRPEAKDFLKTLGSCSKNDNENGNGTIDFDVNGETFKYEKYCGTCSEFKVKCNNRVCSGTNVTCNGTNKNSISANHIIDDKNGNGNIEMLVSDNSGNGFTGVLDECLLPECGSADIFKGIRKEQWTCGKVCGLDVCKPKNGNGQNDGTYIIQIRALLRRWVENFLEDYNKIKQKISHCTKKDNESTCINGCKDKCNCVEKWIKLKTKEWENIKNNHLKKNENGENNIKSLIKNILEKLQSRPEFKNAIKPCKGLTQFESFCGLNGDESSQKSKNSNEKDLVQCLLEKLGERATSCQSKHSDKTEQQCQDPTPEPDDEDLLLEEENTVEAPKICEKVVSQEPEPEDEDACKTEGPQPDVKEEEEEKEEEKDKGDEEDEEEEEEESVSDSYDDYSDSETEEDDQNEAVTDTSSHSESQPERLPRQFPSTELKNAMLFSTILWMVGIGFAAFTYFFLKKKPKSPVDLLRVLDIHKGDYGMPTLKSKNRYIPYKSGSYKGKTYIYMEGDSDSGHYYEDTTDITSSESEYEEMDINDIYVPGSPKYKTLIEVVLEPSKRDIQSDDIPRTNTFTDEEWNELKHDFISQYVQREPLDVPQYDVSTESPMNIVGNVLDDGINEKPFITSIHDRNLYTGEEISYNIHMSTNIMDDTSYVSNNVYSGIDLINDTLSGNKHIDIYDEVLKRKENELYGTNYKKNTSNNNVAKLTNSDPIMNQLDLLHRWLDRHRDMCEKWNKKEELLEKLNEEWNKDNDGGNVPIDNRSLNTDVSIEIDMDDPKGKKEFTNMDTILDDIEDDIYYDVNDENPSVDDISMDHNRVDVPKKVHVEMKILNNTSTGSLEREFPISDVWNI
ncbi:hypothetical protein C923_02032 [Plasmodium falciparum UGT5.1]|uniref:Erythrocyte membrane protein 1 n=1 Tax=Plasmodium falciparum UGT5.1 TaxID=1237627 RepID=W7JQK6_PLAFA|nr:hypothetical protein C923_02032 [Plasmodium falciparum UGT5.1]